MTRPLFLCIAALLFGCAATRDTATLEREPPASAQQVAQRQAAMAQRRPMEPTAAEKFDIAVIGGSCAPRLGAKFAVTACVNEQPCNGYGTRLPGGRLACACFEVPGGCESGSFCNHRTRQCVKLPGDQYHTQ